MASVRIALILALLLVTTQARPRNCIPASRTCTCFEGFKIVQCVQINVMPVLPSYVARVLTMLTVLRHTLSHIPQGYIEDLPKLRILNIGDQVGGYFDCSTLPDTPNVTIIAPPSCKQSTVGTEQVNSSGTTIPITESTVPGNVTESSPQPSLKLCKLNISYPLERFEIGCLSVNVWRTSVSFPHYRVNRKNEQTSHNTVLSLPSAKVARGIVQNPCSM